LERRGDSKHQEDWIPAEDLPLFNANNIMGKIEISAEFRS
jgi:hypothetical protein